MASTNASLVSLLLVFFLATFAFPAEEGDCLYTIYVKTGKEANAGTGSTVSLRLYNEDDDVVDIKNLLTWGGLMGSNYNYFKMSNLDIFSGRGKCLSPPFCAIDLTSDGSGDNPNWYCDYVEVTSTGVYLPCYQKFFKVEQWLEPGLTVTRNSCLPHRDGTEFGSHVVSSVLKLSRKIKH